MDSILDDPSDWSDSWSPMNQLDESLRCPICGEFFKTAMLLLHCSHNFCSLCIRNRIATRPTCPVCDKEVHEPDLRPNRVLDNLINVMRHLRHRFLHHPPPPPPPVPPSTPDTRPRLPTPHFHTLTLKALNTLLLQQQLPTTGTRAEKIQLYKTYLRHYHANLDAVPEQRLSKTQLRALVLSPTTLTASPFTFDSASHQMKYRDQFESLRVIASCRGEEKRKRTDTETEGGKKKCEK